MREWVVQLGDEEYVLLVTLHHIVTDGWSDAILVREFGLLYESSCRKEASGLPELALQYGDYAAWQREWLQGEELERQVEYWRKKLEQAPALELGQERPEKPTEKEEQGAVGTMQRLEIGPELTGALRRLSRREGVTMFMVLLAALKVVLGRWAGQTDVVVGTVIANRNRTEVENLIGFFVNTLALRTSLAGDPSFAELLSRVRETVLEAQEHQDLPFEKVVEAVAPERNLSRSPLFQAVFNMWVAGEAESRPVQGLQLEDASLQHTAPKFELSFGLRDNGKSLSGSVVYRKDRFAPEMIAAMEQQLLELLLRVVEQPEERLSELYGISGEEWAQLEQGNGREQAIGWEKSVHELFEEQAQRTPQAVAVSSGVETLTYAELNRKANQVAAAVRERGVGAETRVALCLDRSLEMVVALLGVLKAGGCYVPLDPEYPVERLAYAGRLGPAVVLTQQKWVERLGTRSQPVICLDSDWAKIARHSEENPGVKLEGGNAAYVIYTSGSTGKPKGVVVSHFNVVRLLQATQAYYQFNATDCWTLFHSYAFDFSVWEIWGALAYGGRLVVVSYMVSRSTAEFYELVRAEKVTVLNQTPSAWNQFMQEDEERKASLNLRYVIFGGEALVPSRSAGWLARHGNCEPRLVNMYGITETTVHVTLYEVQQQDAEQSRSLVGAPISNLQRYVLDA